MKKVMMKKAMIFVIDALIGIVIATMILTFTHMYVSRTDENTFPTLHLERIGNDIVTVLDYSGTFLVNDARTLNGKQGIQDAMMRILPDEYNMTLQLEYSSGSTEVLGTPPSDKAITSGGQIVLTNEAQPTFAYVRFFIWSK